MKKTSRSNSSRGIKLDAWFQDALGKGCKRVSPFKTIIRILLEMWIRR